MATPPLDGRVVHGVLFYMLDTTALNLTSPSNYGPQDTFPFPFGRDYLSDPTHLNSTLVARYPPEQPKAKRRLAAKDPTLVDPETGKPYIDDLLTDLIESSLSGLIYPAGIKLSRTQLPTTCHSFILAGVKEMNSADPIESTRKKPSFGFAITQWTHVPKQIFEAIKLQCSYQFFNELPVLPGELPEPPNALFAPRSIVVMASSNHFSAICEGLLRMSQDCLFDIDLCQFIYHVFDQIPTAIDRGPTIASANYLVQRKMQAKRKLIQQHRHKKQQQQQQQQQDQLNPNSTPLSPRAGSITPMSPGIPALVEATDFLDQQHLLERGRRAIIRQPRINQQVLHDPKAVLAHELIPDLVPPLVIFNSVNSPISGPSVHLSSISHSHLHLTTSDWQLKQFKDNSLDTHTTDPTSSPTPSTTPSTPTKQSPASLNTTTTPSIAISPTTPLPASLLTHPAHLHTSISAPRPLILTPLKGLPFYAPPPLDIAQTLPSFVFPQYPFNTAPLVDPHQFYLLLRTLSPSIIIHIITAIFSQISVLCVSEDISLLTPCLQAILSLIYPFEFTTSYIPILSSKLPDLLDNLQAFLYGAHTSMLENDLSLLSTSFFIVDFTKNTIVYRSSKGDIYPMPPPVPKLQGTVTNLARRVIHLFKFDSGSEFSELSIHKARMKRFHQLPIAYFNTLIKQWNDSLTAPSHPIATSSPSILPPRPGSSESQSSVGSSQTSSQSINNPNSSKSTQSTHCNCPQHTSYGYQYSSPRLTNPRASRETSGERLTLLTSLHHKSQTICPIHGLHSVLQMKATLPKSLTVAGFTAAHSHDEDQTHGHAGHLNEMDGEFEDIFSPYNSPQSSQFNPTQGGHSPYHVMQSPLNPHKPKGHQDKNIGCIPIYQSTHDSTCPLSQHLNPNNPPAVPTQYHYELLPELLDLSNPSLLLLSASPQLQLQQMCISCQYRVLTYRPNQNNIPLSLATLPPKDQHLLLPAFSKAQSITYDSLMEQFNRGNLHADDIIQYNLSRLKLDSPWSSLGEIGHNRVGCCISSAHGSVCPIGFESILPNYTNPNSLDLGRYGLSQSTQHPSHPTLAAATSTKSNSIMAMLSGGNTSAASFEIDSIHDTSSAVPLFSLDDFEVNFEDHDSTPMFSSIQQSVFQLQRLRYQQRHFNRGVWGPNAFNSSLITELVVPRIDFLTPNRDHPGSLEGFLNDDQPSTSSSKKSTKTTILRPAPSFTPSYSHMNEDSYYQPSTTRSYNAHDIDDYGDDEASTQQVLTCQPAVFEVGDPTSKNNYTIPELRRLPWRIALRMYLSLLLTAIQIRSSLKMAFPFHEEQTMLPIDPDSTSPAQKAPTANQPQSPNTKPHKDHPTDPSSPSIPHITSTTESESYQFKQFHLNRQRISAQGLHVHPSTSEIGMDYESYFLFYPTISTTILNNRLSNPVDASFATQKKKRQCEKDDVDLFSMLRTAPAENNNVRFQDFHKSNEGCLITSLPFPDFTVYNSHGQAQSKWLQNVKVIYFAFNPRTQKLVDLTFGQVELPDFQPTPTPDELMKSMVMSVEATTNGTHKTPASPTSKRPFLRRVFGRRSTDMIEAKNTSYVLLDQLPCNTIPALIIDHEQTLLQYCCRLIDYSRQVRISAHMKNSIDQIDSDFFSPDSNETPTFSYPLHISNSRRSFTTPTFHPVSFYLYSSITPVFVTPATFFNELVQFEHDEQVKARQNRSKISLTAIPSFPEDEDMEILHSTQPNDQVCGTPLFLAMSPQQLELTTAFRRQRSTTLTQDPEDDGFDGDDTVYTPKYLQYAKAPYDSKDESNQIYVLPSTSVEDISISFDPELSIVSGNSVFSQSMLSVHSIQSTLNTDGHDVGSGQNTQNPMQTQGERLYNTTKLSEFEGYIQATFPASNDNQVLLTKDAVDALHSGSDDSICNFDDITRAYYGNTDSMTDSEEENNLTVMSQQFSRHSRGTAGYESDSAVVSGDCDFDLPMIPNPPKSNKALHRTSAGEQSRNGVKITTSSTSTTLRSPGVSVLESAPADPTPLSFSQYPRLWKVSPHSMSASPIRSFRTSFLSSYVSLYQGYWLSFTRAQKQRHQEFDRKRDKKGKNIEDDATEMKTNYSSTVDQNVAQTIELKQISPHDHNCNTAELLHNTHDDLFRSWLGAFSDQNQNFSHFCSQRQGTLASSESIRTWRRQWTIIRKLARDRGRFAAQQRGANATTNEDGTTKHSIVSKVYTSSLPHPITYTHPSNRSSAPVIASELFDTLDLTPNIRNRCCFNIDCDCQFIPATSFNSPFAGMIGFTQSSDLLENISRPILDPMTATCQVPVGTSLIFTGLLNRIRSQPLFRGVRVPDWFDLQCLLKQQQYSVQLDRLGKKSILSLLHLKSPSSFITSWSQYLFELSTTPKGSQLSYYTSTQQFNDTEAQYRTAIHNLQTINKRLESGSALTRAELLSLSARKSDYKTRIASLREHRQKLRDTHRIGSITLFEGGTVISIPDPARLPSRAPSAYCFELTIGLDETSLKHLIPLLNQDQSSIPQCSSKNGANKQPNHFAMFPMLSSGTAPAYNNPLYQSIQRITYSFDAVKRYQQTILRDKTQTQAIQSVLDQLQVINSYVSSKSSVIGWIFDHDLLTFGPRQLPDLYDIFHVRLKQLDASAKTLTSRLLAQSTPPNGIPAYNLVQDIGQLSYYQSSAFGSSLTSISSPHPPLLNDTGEFVDVINEHSYCPSIPIRYTQQVLQNAAATQITLVSKQHEQQGWLLVKTQQITSALISSNTNQTKRLNMSKYAVLQELSERQVHAMAHGLLLPSVHIHNPLSSLLLTPRTMPSSITTLRSVQRQVHYSFFTTTGYQHDYLQPLHAEYLKTPSDFRCQNVIPINRHDETFRQQVNGKKCREVILDTRQKPEFTDADASTMFYMTLPLHASMLNPLTPIVLATQTSMQVLSPYLSLPTYLPESLQEALQHTSSKDKDEAKTTTPYLFINGKGDVSLTPNPQIDPKQNKSSSFKFGKSSSGAQKGQEVQDSTFIRVYPANKKANMGLTGISQGEIDILNMHGILMDPLTFSEFLSQPPPTIENFQSPSPYMIQPLPAPDMTSPPSKPTRFADIPAAVRGLRSVLWPMTGCPNILSNEQAKNQPAFANKQCNSNTPSQTSLDSADPTSTTQSPTSNGRDSTISTLSSPSTTPFHSDRQSVLNTIDATNSEYDGCLSGTSRSQQRPSYLPSQLHHTQRYLAASRLISASPEVLMGLYNACEKAFDSLVVMGAININSHEMDHQNTMLMCEQHQAQITKGNEDFLWNPDLNSSLSPSNVVQQHSELGGLTSQPILNTPEITQTHSSQVDTYATHLSATASSPLTQLTSLSTTKRAKQSDTLTLLVQIHDQHRANPSSFHPPSISGTTLCSRASIFSTINLTGVASHEHTPPVGSQFNNKSSNTFTYPAPHPVSPLPPEKSTATFTFCASDSKTRNIWIKAVAARTVIHTHDYISVAQSSLSNEYFDLMEQPLDDFAQLAELPSTVTNPQITAGAPTAQSATQFVLTSAGSSGTKFDVSTSYAVLLALLHLGKAIDRVDNLWFVTSFAAVLLRSKSFNRIDLIDWCLHHSGTSPAAAVLAQILTAPTVYKLADEVGLSQYSIYHSPTPLTPYPYLLQDLLPLCLTPRTTFYPLASSIDPSALANSASSFTKMRILFATIRQFTVEDDTHTVQSFLGAIKNQIIASIIKCLHHTDPIVDIFAYLLHPEMDDSAPNSDQSFSSCICGCCKDTSFNGSTPLIVSFPVVYRAVCAALFEFIGVLHSFVCSFVTQHFVNIQRLQTLIAQKSQTDSDPGSSSRVSVSWVEALNWVDDESEGEDQFDPNRTSAATAEQKLTQVTFTPHDLYRYMMALLIYSTPLSPQLGPHNAYLAYLEESIIATKQVMRSYSLLNAKSRYSVYKITNQDFVLYLISTGRYDAATACRLVIIAADLGMIYNSGTAADVRIIPPQIQVKTKQHIVSVYRGFESFHDSTQQDFKQSQTQDADFRSSTQTHPGLSSSTLLSFARDSMTTSAPNSPLGDSFSSSPFLPTLSPQLSKPTSPQLSNSTPSSQQSNSKKYCTMLAANTYFICSPRHHTHYTHGVIPVSNTTEYLRHQSYESFCMNVSYLNTMCYSHFAIPIFKSFWVSSPLFDSPFTVPPAYINRYHTSNSTKHCLTMEVNNHLFNDNKYPLPVIVPPNLSKLSTPSPTSSKLSLQFSSGNNYYFNHSSYQTCICQSILEPTSVDLTLLYILRSTFNTIHTEKIKQLYPHSLHSFAISFNGQQALTALLQQHAIATSEKEAIGLLTRLLHLNLITNLDQLEAHHSNQKKQYRIECDHVKPLPSFTPSANYIISLQLQDQN